MAQVDIFREGFEENVKGGFLVEKKKLYKAASNLYFKALISLSDYLLLKNIGKTVSSHTERFRLLEQRIPFVYNIVDTLFSIYQNAYSKPIDKEACEEIRNGIKKIIEHEKLEEFEEIHKVI